MHLSTINFQVRMYTYNVKFENLNRQVSKKVLKYEHTKKVFELEI